MLTDSVWASGALLRNHSLGSHRGSPLLEEPVVACLRYWQSFLVSLIARKVLTCVAWLGAQAKDLTCLTSSHSSLWPWMEGGGCKYKTWSAF